MNTPLTEPFKAQLEITSPTITFKGQTIQVSTLPPNIQTSIVILNEWQAQRKWSQVELNKLDRAIRTLQEEIGILIANALEPAPTQES